jgi:HAMP domain-containing protein
MQIFKLIPKNFSLGKKLTILMLTIFLVGTLFSSIIYYRILLGYAENELTTNANLLISTMDSVRKYNRDKVSPLLKKQSNEKFVPESVPSFAVRGVFDTLINSYKDEYGEFLYKDAMLNPTSVKDQASDSEMKIIEKLYQQDNRSEENIDRGYLMIDGEKHFYTARPIKISQSNCLECHSTLSRAPKSLQILYQQGVYKPNAGLGWELNKVIGTKIIFIPANKVFNAAKEHFFRILGIFVAIFAVAIFLVNLWLKNYVVQPLSRMTRVAEAVSMGDMDADFEKQSNDEVGRLAEAFTRLKTSLAITLRKLSQKNNQ